MSHTRYAPPIYNTPQRRQLSIIVQALDPAAATYDINAEPGSFAVTGSEATLARGLFINAEPGSFAISGADATFQRTFSLDCQPGSFAISGTDATLARDLNINAEPGSFAISGAEATLEYVPLVVEPRNVALRATIAYTPALLEQVSVVIQAFEPAAPAAYSLNAEPGSFAISGSAATVARDISLNAEPGSFAVTGVAASLVADRAINAEPGSFAISGAEATLEFVSGPAAPPNVALRAIKAHSPLPRQQTSQFIQAFDVPNAYELNAEPAVYAISGVETSLTYDVPTTWDRIVAPNYAHSTVQIVYGSRVFGGVEEAAGTAYEINAQPGTYTITGVAATVVATRVLSADPASYTISGTSATLARGLFINAEPGSFAITGVDGTTSYFPSIFFTSTVSVQTSIVVSGGTANRAYELPMRGVG